MSQRLPIPAANARRLLIAATLLSAVLWYIPGAELVTYPIRLFVTLIHEGGHAAITLLTGGQVERIALDARANGLTLSLGGLPFLIYMAGYLGTTVFGALSLQITRRPGSGPLALGMMAGVALVLTLLWVRNGFGFGAGLGIALVLLLLARYLRQPAADFAAAFLSVQLCLNALFDLRNLLFMSTVLGGDNDAVFMARMYGLTPWFWAILWAVGAGAILLGALRAYWGGSR
ncbi:MAG TPA: M50 family metallopeptidase [Chthonomonadales bacterium]|nr:M50 family metallopeptidase [Chthonomonadales bacterium]